MSLRLKAGIPLERLREFGYAPGYELAKDPKFAEFFDRCDYMLSWWHKFALDEDGGIDLADDTNPVVHGWVRDDNWRQIWFDATPCCTYHVGMDELDLVTDTVFAMTQAGVLEVCHE